MSKRKSPQPARSSHHRSPAVHTEASTEEPKQPIPSGASIADAARQRLISDAAYYRAQKRNFAPGQELDDWLAAEAEVTQSSLDRQPTGADLH
jgi:Protein of unknown function (DUF2934)